MQDFYNPIPMDLTVVRGDTLAFNFQLEGADNVSDITFTCKNNPDDTEAVFNQSLTHGGIVLINSENGTDTYSVRIRPDQTEGLDIARYYYDLELKAGYDVITLMKGRLIVDWDATN